VGTGATRPVALERDWPPLPYEAWRETRDTLHMYTQVIGKLRLALSPFEPEWANVPLYVTARGLTTSPLPVGLRTIDAELDLIDHLLVLRSSDGTVERRPLGGSVADFYQDVMRSLERMHVDVALSVVPSEVPNPIPFPDDRVHDTYNPQDAGRFFQVLSGIAVVMKAHRARFRGRTTPVHFFWGTFDLALTRYSGRPADPVPNAGMIMRVSEDAEEICAGWWPGDEKLPYPAFYAYVFPAPDGIEAVELHPPAASWDAPSGLYILRYEAARTEADPRQAVLAFLESTYAGGASLLGWDTQLTEVEAPASGVVSGSQRGRSTDGQHVHTP